jgi:hypothetical protein
VRLVFLPQVVSLTPLIDTKILVHELIGDFGLETQFGIPILDVQTT